ncbi:amino acid transporter [Pseudidiomarina aestuarii]|uniref:Amino acid transporter n=1 Tax=Pseudidiomarina aestuarii TaxID=624146 RepID=A0A6N4DKJ9_9GAMM|nr:amino acid transporter [Pseudidiomarina aestuarii]
MEHSKLQRTTGLPGAVLLGLGSIVGTGAFVSIGFGAEIAGSYLVWAIALAAIVAACNGLSSAQLAAIHPVSGGTYEYGYRFLNHDLGFTAGWLFVLAKSASAATAALAIGTTVANAFGWSGYAEIGLSIAVLAALTALVMGGLKRSNRANAVLVAIAIAALVLFIGYSYTLEPVTAALDAAQEPQQWSDVLAAAALLFVAYTGYGRIATMGEEVTEPRHTIPRAITTTVLVVTILYLFIGVALLNFPLGTADSLVLADLAKAQQAPTWLYSAIAIGAVVAMAGVVLNLLLGVSRVVLAMARRKDLPGSLSNLNAERTSAPAAILFSAAVMLVLVLIGDLQIAWSFSAFTVLVYYSLTNLAALQVNADLRFIPRWISILGLLSCLSLAAFVELTVLGYGIGLIVIGLIWHRIRRSSAATSEE